MVKIIWVIEKDRAKMLELQRGINSFGSMRAMCMLSYDALKKTIKERIDAQESQSAKPSLILADYAMIRENPQIVTMLKDNPRLAGVPLFFVDDNGSVEDDEYYLAGAMVVLKFPVSHSGFVRIERAAWQYEVTGNYERILQKQISELEGAKEIQRLNDMLASRNEFLHMLFGKYFSDDVLNVILEKPEGALVGGDRRMIMVMMADLRGFSSIADAMEPDDITDMLNCYFGVMVDVISRFGGTVIEFMGDGILAVFGAPVGNGTYCDDAIAAAISMQNEMSAVNDYCAKKGYEQLEMGIGLHCGETFVGNVGSEKMMRYNVIGRTVNECSRIEGCSVGGQVLISENVLYNTVSDVRVVEMAKIFAKGIREPLKIYEVKGIGGNYDCIMNSGWYKEMFTTSENIWLKLHPVEGKVVKEKYFPALLKKFSIGNAVVEIADIPDELQLFGDVEVRFGTNGDEPGFAGVYAKIMKVDDESVLLHFTHVNREFRRFEDRVMMKYCERGEAMNDMGIMVVHMELDDLKQITSHVEAPSDCTLYWAKNGADISVVCTSSEKSIRALEFMDFLVLDYAMINGDDKIAKADITKAFLDVMMSELDVMTVEEFFYKKIDRYYNDCQWIYGDKFLEANEDAIRAYTRYVKKRIPWACVKTTDVVTDGDKFRLKSLENESDIIVTASENVYIMIGCRGEIYCIDSGKFHNTYEFSDEKLDIFEQMLDYLPEIKKFPEDEYISLDLEARLCYPKPMGGIYATQLTKRTKVFTEHNKGDYFVGRKGDFLAVRTDDLTDMYIIQKEIFYQTYDVEKVNE